MKKKDIEKRLNKIISTNVPNVYEDVLARCKQEKIKKVGKEVEFMKQKKERKINYLFSKIAVGFAVIVLCLCGTMSLRQYANSRVDSIIEFDVNPSIEIATNKKEEVIKVKALNEDGKKVLGNMKLDDVNLDIAVNAIIGSMLKNGYITEAKNSILVSVKNPDSKKAKNLEERLSKEITSVIKTSNIESSVLTQSYDDNIEIEKLAERYNISDGKATLIKKILKAGIKDSKGNLYEFETLSKLSINELELLLNSKNTKVDNITSTGKTSEKALIGKDEAKKIAFAKAKVNTSKVFDLEVELDAVKGVLVYEVEFQVGNKEYEYDINAKTGEIVSSKIEIDDDRD